MLDVSRAPAPDGPLRWDQEEDGFSTLPVRAPSPLRWEPPDAEGFLRLYVPRKRSWRRLRAHWAPLLEGLAAGERLPALFARARAALPHRTPAQVRFIMNRALPQLRDWGLLEVTTPPPPARFAGRYEVVRELGRGGMGVVWLCRDADAGGDLVAVKHAWNFSGAFARREKHLREEAEAMRALDHASVVRYRGAFDEDGRFHLVRAYLEGTRLTDAAKGGGLDAATRAAYTRQAAEAWTHIRQRGMLYLDLKPSNFYVTAQEGRVVLGDLGMCRRLPPGQDSVKGLFGTLSYMGPEVMKGAPATERSLVFSLGRLHYHLVVGKQAKVKTPFERLLASARRAGATAGERAFLQACCDPDPARRPATMGEAVRLLEAP